MFVCLYDHKCEATGMGGSNLSEESERKIPGFCRTFAWDFATAF
jgi:hypothetical protein